MNAVQLSLGVVLGVGVAWAARKAKALSRSGMLGAALVGAVIFGVGGLPWAALLLAFFVSSSLLSRLFRRQKQGLDEKFSKGHERDLGQVFGNGGVAALLAALHAFFPEALWPWMGFAAALAAVNADTWATELGVLNPSAPRLITSPGRQVEKGTSGGVSLWGTAAAFLGSALIALLAVWLSPYPGLGAGAWLLLSLAGLAGSLFDSLLGATLQAIYFCPACRKETERHPLHSCGTQTLPLRGCRWLNNDLVNLGCSVLGALLVLLALLLR